MLGTYPLGEAPLAANLNPSYFPVTDDEEFNVFATVISQYANSPVLLAVVEYFAAWFDAGLLFDLFYRQVWNVDTAEGYGLDVLGRIVGVSRIVNIPSAGTYIGFEGQPTAQNWGHGIWNHGADATSNVRLDDATYRRVILAKARANICNGSIPAINQILIDLFPGYGNCYVIDTGAMTMTYHFGAALSPVDFAIASQENILPKPLGVTVTITQGP